MDQTLWSVVSSGLYPNHRVLNHVGGAVKTYEPIESEDDYVFRANPISHWHWVYSLGIPGERPVGFYNTKQQAYQAREKALAKKR